jgi:hypothetical protein
MGAQSTCAFCSEPFCRDRPAGEIVITIPVEQETMMLRLRICMACLLRMMGESLDRLLEAARVRTRSME